MIKGFNSIQIENHLRGQMECAVLERGETSFTNINLLTVF